jgi:hypothetical protein
VARPGAQVAVQGGAGLVPERQRPLAAALAQHQQHVQVQIHVGELEVDQLGPAGAGVDQQHDHGGVPAGLEALAGAGGQEPAQAVVGDHRDRLVGHDRRAHLGHRAGRELVFVLEPLVEQLQDLVVGGGGGGGPSGEQVAQVGFQVGPAGLGEGGAPAPGQEGLGLAEADQVGGYRLVGAVLGAQVPLEGAEQGVGRGGVHARRSSTVITGAIKWGDANSAFPQLRRLRGHTLCLHP